MHRVYECGDFGLHFHYIFYYYLVLVGNSSLTHTFLLDPVASLSVAIPFHSLFADFYLPGHEVWVFLKAVPLSIPSPSWYITTYTLQRQRSDDPQMHIPELQTTAPARPPYFNVPWVPVVKTNKQTKTSCSPPFSQCSILVSVRFSKCPIVYGNQSISSHPGDSLLPDAIHVQLLPALLLLSCYICFLQLPLYYDSPSHSLCSLRWLLSHSR